MAKGDANGNHTCYSYDALHRVTDVVNNNESATNPCKRFRYDGSLGVLGALPSGVHDYNPFGRLVEAETDTCAWPITQSSILTDEWYSYSTRGEVTDFFQSTPHSGMYYHPTQAYWPSGALETLWISGLPVITYNLDGEGRTNSVTASAGQNPVNFTTYSTAGQVTQVQFGSYDGDVFNYDSNTGRMTQYQNWAQSGSKAYGTLNWNANGTLGTLNIVDPFNSGDNQNCSYGYDDLVRLSSVNCGSPWSQTFTYDAFGNITKSGSISWNPGYNSATNRYTLGGTVYDADGNLLNDTFHTYTWNLYGRAASMDSIALTYDAFDRQVEKSQSGAYTQTVYSPSGKKLGLFNGSTIQKIFVLLPSGTVATYASGGLSNYRHADWLGSDRLESDPNSHNVVDNNAYAPFGEPYAQTGNGEVSFTGMNSDTLWPQYDFTFRQYQPQQGRWISPDPAGIAAVDPGSPQSWNRYAYVMNNPLANMDEMGLGLCTIPSTMEGDQPQCPDDPNYNPSNITGPGTSDLPGGHTGGPGVAMDSTDLQDAYAAYDQEMSDIFWDNYWAAQQQKEQHTADCIRSGLQSTFPVADVSTGASTGEVGGHWNFAVVMAFPSQTDMNTFDDQYDKSAATGWPPPARFGPGPALHLENLGDMGNGAKTEVGTAHIDLYNPDTGKGGIAGHVFVDGLWGHVVQFFGGNLDPKTCPF